MKSVFSINSMIDMIKKFFALQLNRSAAAISYYLILTLFPMLICVQWILGSLGEDIIAFLNGISDIIPANALGIIEDYLRYTGSQSDSLLIIGIITAVFTGASAFRTLSDTLRNIYESHGGNATARFIFSFVYAIALLVAIYFLAVITVAGRWLINLLAPLMEQLDYIMFFDLANLWNWFRFVILDIITAAMLYTIYYFSAWRSPIRINVLPGAIFGSVVFTVVSGFFSWFISSSVKYSAIYGSLASVIILMLWLYIFGNIVIIGSLINKELAEHKNDPQMKIHSNIHNFIKKRS